ncbi:asparagine synthase (glutamine-hydrolyzing), partial [bacterium]|nr:asparagine synthase (glutamine-hydrolyzing) [bacterium]
MSHLWGIVSSLGSFSHPIDKRAIFGMSRVPGSLIEKRCFQGKGKTAEIVLGYRGRDTILRPFSNETKTIWVILEGAIYNSRELIQDLKDSGHFLASNSDGEVIAHLYESYREDCIPRLNGKFTLAIWDQKRESLFLASDRMGQIPMYYIKLGNQLIFASQLNAILQHPEIEPEVDLNLLTKYLAYGFVPTPNTLLKGIQKLSSGHWLKYQHNRVAFTKYWDVHFSNQSKVFPDKSKKEYSQRIYRLLHTSIQRRLDSNGHWGVFLSGGLDSSSLVAILSELVPSSSVKTFTVGFEKRSFDETEPAREIATLFKTEHHEVLLTPQKLLELLPGIVAAMDEPFSDDDVIGSCLVAQTAKRYVNVALAGDGADELFMGYPAFLAHRLADYYERLPWLIRHFFMEQI